MVPKKALGNSYWEEKESPLAFQEQFSKNAKIATVEKKPRKNATRASTKVYSYFTLLSYPQLRSLLAEPKAITLPNCQDPSWKIQEQTLRQQQSLIWANMMRSSKLSSWCSSKESTETTPTSWSTICTNGHIKRQRSTVQNQISNTTFAPIKVPSQKRPFLRN